MKKTYNWGMLGAGLIANKFAEGLKELSNASCYAVAARSLERAEVFRQEHGFQKAYGSYTDMLADPQVDIVYISTTNNFHFEHTMMCLEAGKSVLCEKPFASNLAQVKLMIEKAVEKNVFLMEALWTRFIPSMIQLKEQMQQGVIGIPKMLQCDFGFYAPFDPKHRNYNPELGGGSIPDIGIYPIFTSLFLFGKPVTIQVASVPAPTGADWTTAVLFQHTNSIISMLSSSFATVLDNEACVYGDKGSLKLHAMFHMPVPLSFKDNDGEVRDVPLNLKGNGYNYEAAEVMSCLDQGKIESDALSHAFSIELMEVLEEVIRLAKASY